MRVTGLLVLSLLCLISFCLISVCAVPASAQESPAIGASASPANSASPSELLMAADSFDKRYGILRNDPDSDLGALDTPAQRYFARMKHEEDGVCYKLRSYKVARDDRNSDSTHPVGYSTCQRASRFQMRNAEEPMEMSSR
jgi:hypothetical protein